LLFLKTIEAFSACTPFVRICNLTNA
jgi:hypothetical protein